MALARMPRRGKVYLMALAGDTAVVTGAAAVCFALVSTSVHQEGTCPIRLDSYQAGIMRTSLFNYGYPCEQKVTLHVGAMARQPL